MISRRTKRRANIFIIAVAAMMLAAFGVTVSRAQEDEPEGGQGETGAPEAPEAGGAEQNAPDLSVVQTQMGSVSVAVDTVWVLLTGSLVFLMQLGFALLETGLLRQTSAVNALLENFINAGVTAIIFWAVGFGIAFGTDESSVIGTDNFFLNKAIEFEDGVISFPSIAEANTDVLYPNLAVLTFFFFQFAFAATAITIITGSMAERTDFIGDLIYTGIMAALGYPIIVHWVWGGGWLFDASFHDFAGSTVVHTFGGVTALMGAYLLGVRANRMLGSPPAGHNLAYATMGTLILWFGWYGFNPGSTLGTGNTGLIGLVTVNTTLGASAGALGSMFFQYFRAGKWDLAYTLNGTLAGLVSITAGCAFVEPWAAVVMGAIAGIIVILAVDVVEGVLKIDDPVGAFAVHGACGIWGTLAIGIFGVPELMFGEFKGLGGLVYGGGIDSLITQLMGSVATIAFSAMFAFIMFSALKMMGHLRVHPTADQIGIDNYEHGASVWPDVLPPISNTEK